jgi:hypothetical protein
MTRHDYDQWAEASLTGDGQLAATLPVLPRESAQPADLPDDRNN